MPIYIYILLTIFPLYIQLEEKEIRYFLRNYKFYCEEEKGPYYTKDICATINQNQLSIYSKCKRSKYCNINKEDKEFKCESREEDEEEEDKDKDKKKDNNNMNGAYINNYNTKYNKNIKGKILQEEPRKEKNKKYVWEGESCEDGDMCWPGSVCYGEDNKKICKFLLYEGEECGEGKGLCGFGFSEYYENGICNCTKWGSIEEEKVVNDSKLCKTGTAFIKNVNNKDKYCMSIKEVDINDNTVKVCSNKECIEVNRADISDYIDYAIDLQGNNKTYVKGLGSSVNPLWSEFLNSFNDLNLYDINYDEDKYTININESYYKYKLDWAIYKKYLKYKYADAMEIMKIIYIEEDKGKKHIMMKYDTICVNEFILKMANAKYLKRNYLIWILFLLIHFI